MNINRVFLLTVSLFLFVSVATGFGKGQEDEMEMEMEEMEEMTDTEFAYETRGPQGEAPTAYSEVNLSSDDKSAVRSGGYKAAILLHTSADWTNAIINGARDMFEDLGVKVVAVTDAEFDSNKQRTDIETSLALDPDIIITLVLDPVSGAEALRQARDRDVKIVLISNLPTDFVHGRDYVGIVTDDLFQMGKSAAEMIGNSLNGKGEVALIYHDADYYVTNQRDMAVEAVLRQDYPDIKIVTRKGIVNPSDGDVIASAILTQFPDVDAIYAPWDTIAEGVVAGVRSVGNSDVGVFTMDLGANNVMDLAKGGHVKGIVADLPYVLGQTLAKMGALGVLGKDAPAFVTVPAIKVNKDNVGTEWERSLNRPLPGDIQKELN